MSIFTTPQKTKVKSNTFNLTHDFKFSANIGNLVPINCMEAVPGDSFNLKSSLMVRFAPMVAPIMHQCQMKIYHFFVPNRLLWSNWEKFITGYSGSGSNPSLDTPPFFRVNYGFEQVGVEIGELADYLGLPTNDDLINGGTEESSEVRVSALPFAAYQKIYNDYFRSEWLQAEEGPDANPLVNGDNTNQWGAYNELHYKNWEHDYFTSALPEPQKGVEAMLPISDGEVKLVDSFDYDPPKFVQWQDLNENASNGVISAGNSSIVDDQDNPIVYDPKQSLYVDFSEASIVNLRRAIKLQEWLERNARGGTRYIESIYSHFGVTSSDKRLQRAEYIGSSNAPIKISEVLQTSETNQDSTPQGNMSGHGIGYGGDKGYKYFAEEHGFIITLACVMPRTSYQQGIHKMFKRFDRFDYYWPEFAAIGEQAIAKVEVGLVNGDDEEAQNEVWGYIPRYSEYKYMNSRVAGDFRTTLDTWHMGRKWVNNLTPLSSAFIKANHQEVDRVFAYQGGLKLWCMALNEVKANRKMPYFGNPSL